MRAISFQLFVDGIMARKSSNIRMKGKPVKVPRLLRPNKPVMFMGADVTHPCPLDDINPSDAAVVGSINWLAANKYVSRMRSQTHRQEIIWDLGAMVKGLLDDFYQELNELP